MPTMTEWKQFAYRNLWQHSLWGDLQEKNGRKTSFLEAEGASALLIRHQLPFGLCWFEIPRGPLFKNEKDFKAIQHKILQLAKKEQAVFVRYSSYQDLPETGLRPTAFDHHPQTSLVLDLDQSGEDILEQMKPKGRYNIKVAEKHDVKLSVSGDVDAFYEVLYKTGNRDGFGIHPASYYQNMLDSLGEHAHLILATYEERIVAGGIFVYLDEWAIYYYGASDHHYRNVMAPYLVQWAAIQEAKKRGCKYYDFLGIAPEGVTNHQWAGVTEFKKKFGGRVVDYPKARDFVLRPFWYEIYKLRKRVG